MRCDCFGGLSFFGGWVVVDLFTVIGDLSSLFSCFVGLHVSSSGK